MAQDDVAVAVKRHRQIAESAVLHVAARGAVQVGCESPPVEQQNHLPAFAQRVPHRPLERGAQPVEPPARIAIVRNR